MQYTCNIHVHAIYMQYTCNIHVHAIYMQYTCNIHVHAIYIRGVGSNFEVERPLGGGGG